MASFLANLPSLPSLPSLPLPFGLGGEKPAEEKQIEGQPNTADATPAAGAEGSSTTSGSTGELKPGLRKLPAFSQEQRSPQPQAAPKSAAERAAAEQAAQAQRQREFFAQSSSAAGAGGSPGYGGNSGANRKVLKERGSIQSDHAHLRHPSYTAPASVSSPSLLSAGSHSPPMAAQPTQAQIAYQSPPLGPSSASMSTPPKRQAPGDETRGLSSGAPAAAPASAGSPIPAPVVVLGPSALRSTGLHSSMSTFFGEPQGSPAAPGSAAQTPEASPPGPAASPPLRRPPPSPQASPATIVAAAGGAPLTLAQLTAMMASPVRASAAASAAGPAAAPAASSSQPKAFSFDDRDTAALTPTDSAIAEKQGVRNFSYGESAAGLSSSAPLPATQPAQHETTEQALARIERQRALEREHAARLALAQQAQEASYVAEHVDDFQQKMREAEIREAHKKEQARLVMAAQAEARAQQKAQADAERQARLKGGATKKLGPASPAVDRPGHSSGAPPAPIVRTVSPSPVALQFPAAALGHEDEEINRAVLQRQRSHAPPVVAWSAASAPSAAAVTGFTISDTPPSPSLTPDTAASSHSSASASGSSSTPPRRDSLTSKSPPPARPPPSIGSIAGGHHRRNQSSTGGSGVQPPLSASREGGGGDAATGPVNVWHAQRLGAPSPFLKQPPPRPGRRSSLAPEQVISPTAPAPVGENAAAWTGCACGCGVAGLACKMLAHQSVILSNLQRQYELMAHYITHVHAGLATHNIALSSILPASLADTRATILGPLMTLEASTRNEVRDALADVAAASTAPAENADPGRITNQPLAPSMDHASYARALEATFLSASTRNTYSPPARSPLAKVDSPMADPDDEQSCDNSLEEITGLSALPVSFAAGRIAQSVFDCTAATAPNSDSSRSGMVSGGMQRMKLDVPEVIVCADMGAADWLSRNPTRKRSNAICFGSRTEVKELNLPSRVFTNLAAAAAAVPATAQKAVAFAAEPAVAAKSDNAAAPVPAAATAATSKPASKDSAAAAGVSAEEQLRRNRRTSLSMGALAAGVSVASSASSGASSVDPVLSVMRHPLGLSLLRAQMLEEHNVENLDVWTKVESFSALPRDDFVGRISKGVAIFHKHIARSASEQINLPFAITDDFETVMRTLRAEAAYLSESLELVASIALKSIQNDTFKRFQHPANAHGNKWRRFVEANPGALTAAGSGSMTGAANQVSQSSSQQQQQSHARQQSASAVRGPSPQPPAHRPHSASTSSSSSLAPAPASAAARALSPQRPASASSSSSSSSAAAAPHASPSHHSQQHPQALATQVEEAEGGGGEGGELDLIKYYLLTTNKQPRSVLLRRRIVPGWIVWVFCVWRSCFLSSSLLFVLLLLFSVLLLDPEFGTLGLYRPGRDGVSIEEDSPLEFLFVRPAIAATTAGDIMAWIKLSANEPAKLTINYHDRTAGAAPNKPLQSLSLYMQTTGARKQIEAERDELFFSIRKHGFMAEPDRRK